MRPPASLSRDQTQVWSLDLDVGADRLARLESLLTGDEQEHAWRFTSAQDRARFVAARGQLRQILASYVDCDPRFIQFSHSPFGKPALAPPFAADDLRFNAAGSESLGLVALRHGAEVGIDVERVRPLPDTDTLATRLLTPEERPEFAGLADAERERRFFEAWVRKEAVAKMIGLGLRQPFTALDLHPWQDEGVKRIELPPEAGAGSAWVMPLALPRPEFVAALAADGPIGEVRVESWDS